MENILNNIEIVLKILGYKLQEDDTEKVDYLIKKHISQIMYICGLEEISEPLNYVIADKVCSEFLKNKIAIGQNVGITIGSNIKDIKIGDVSVSLPENFTNEEKLNLILTKLERNDFDYSPYSRMRW